MTEQLPQNADFGEPIRDPLLSEEDDRRIDRLMDGRGLTRLEAYRIVAPHMINKTISQSETSSPLNADTIKDNNRKPVVDLYSLGQDPEDQAEPITKSIESAEADTPDHKPRTVNHSDAHHETKTNRTNTLLGRSAAQSASVRSSAGYEVGGSAKRLETDAYSRHPQRVTDIWPEPPVDTDLSNGPS